MLSDRGNQLLGSCNFATDCLVKIAAFGCQCTGQPDFQLDAEKQHGGQQGRRLRRARAQPGKRAQSRLNAGNRCLLIVFTQLPGASQSIAHQNCVVVGKLPERGIRLR